MRAAWLLLLAALTAQAQDAPLNLAEALALAAEHPMVVAGAAEAAAAQAGQAAVLAGKDFSLHLNGEVRWVDPSPALTDQSAQDHAAALVLRKTLYDFGRTETLTRVAEHSLAAAQANLLDLQTQHKLTVMAQFFEVLLADLRFVVDDEKMAVAYVTLDKLSKRQALGQVADLQLAEAEYTYHESLQQRLRSEQALRTSRARLANAINRPHNLPAHLSPPDLAALPELPEAAVWQNHALAHNPRLHALQARVHAAQARIAAARAERKPILSGVAEANYWERDFGSRDKARAGLEISIPLYQGGRVVAAVAEAQAQVHEAQAQLAQTQLEVRQAVLDTLMEIRRLQAETRAVASFTRWQDLRLDRNRTLYEMEFDADLGDAMVGQSEARLRAAQNQYALALAWARLQALTGGVPPQETSP
jgi:outer membrane protein TolC